MANGTGNTDKRESAQGDRAISRRAAFWRKTLTDLAIMTVIGVVLAIIGPFGSIVQPLPVRLISWLAFAYLGYMIYSPMGYFVERAHTSLDLPRGPLWLAAALVATVPMAALVYVIRFMPDWPPLPSLETALTTYFYVFVIGGSVTLLFNTLAVRQAPQRPPPPEDRIKAAVVEQSPPESPAPSPTHANPLLDQLPAELGSEVIALEMEDHYVRVHTALGSALVLMRLRDAMAHVSDVEGRQVHRSWWVARGAVEHVEREGRSVRLVLGEDLVAPVSRAEVSELKAAGWI